MTAEIVDAIEVLLETKWHEEKCGCEGGIEHCASAAYGPTAPPSTWTVQAVVDAAGGINPAFDSRHIEDAPCSSCLSCRHLDLMTRLAGLAADLSAYNPGHGDFARAGKRLHDALIPPGACGICGRPLNEVGTSRCYEAHGISALPADAEAGR